jgi:acyl carrier protein
MTDNEVRDAVLHALHRIAPEIDLKTLALEGNLREEADLDSFDFLNLLIELSARFGFDIPESDYARLTSVSDITRYLSARQNSAALGGNKEAG